MERMIDYCIIGPLSGLELFVTGNQFSETSNDPFWSIDSDSIAIFLFGLKIQNDCYAETFLKFGKNWNMSNKNASEKI